MNECYLYTLKIHNKPFKKYPVKGQRVRVKNWIKEMSEFRFLVRIDMDKQFRMRFVNKDENRRFTLTRTTVNIDSLTWLQRHKLLDEGVISG